MDPRQAARLTHKPKFHDLRHAHASWLLAGGADLQVVKQRLGHAKISTTERYLHTLPTADATALDALNKIRVPKSPTTPDSADPDLQAQLEAANEKVTQLQAAIAQQVLDQHLNNTPNLRLA
ncbi:tyrosine-type recombinase/integrase [Actinocorallia sp. A-T 12471]|uniref:tyrosine-type recombinase/integrase n=1 Tax=Actinocorallia sp. A-T 12471 TaxID=3089813 RepID=UPI0039B6F67F